jgi:chromate reductase
MADTHTTDRPEPVRFLVFSASLRKGSYNTMLARNALRVIEERGGMAELANMRAFECPAFDGDLEAAEGLPPGAALLRERLLANDAFVIASPEYNGSMPGHLKNTIDWVSRFRPQPFSGLHALLLSASPSMAGGSHGLWALRKPLEKLGTHVAPTMFSLATANKALDADGNIIDTTLAQRFADTIAGFMDLVEAAKHYPCVKRAWIEFLGERSDPTAAEGDR